MTSLSRAYFALGLFDHDAQIRPPPGDELLEHASARFAHGTLEVWHAGRPDQQMVVQYARAARATQTARRPPIHLGRVATELYKGHASAFHFRAARQPNPAAGWRVGTV